MFLNTVAESRTREDLCLSLLPARLEDLMLRMRFDCQLTIPISTTSAGRERNCGRSPQM